MAERFETTQRASGEPTPSEPRLSLVFYFHNGAKIVVPTESPVTVGRSVPSDVIVDDPSLSRQHARFFVAPDGGIAFEDLQSMNGTRLNGNVVARGRMSAGDEVRVGEVSVALHVLQVNPGISGLAGYDAFVRALDDEILRARTFKRTVSLLMVGARAPGHPLPKWAPALLEKLRPVDRAAVYASDVVLVALPEASRVEADALGEIMTANDAALRFGTASYPEGGTTVDGLLDAARNAMFRGDRPRAPQAETPQKTKSSIVVGERMRSVWEMIDRVASANLPVLVLGETGSGKEVVARALHERGSRKDGPLRSVNCAAIPQNLLESVLFGHEKGAFTGADRTTKGLFEQAHGGTLMLDEIGDLPAGAQAALLRVLETKGVVRVGGDREINVDVRVVAATHRDLERMSQSGQFRADLFYRLQGITLTLPPLRERSEEIGPLADTFLREAARENNRRVTGIDADAMDALLAWRWPGNIRELRNVIERAVVIAREAIVRSVDLPERIREAGASASMLAAAPILSNARPQTDEVPELATTSERPVYGSGFPPVARPTSPPLTPSNEPPSTDIDSIEYKERLRREMQRYETQLIVDALSRSGGNVTGAAQVLKIPVRTLTHKMQALGIKKRFDAE